VTPVKDVKIPEKGVDSKERSSTEKRLATIVLSGIHDTLPHLIHQAYPQGGHASRGPHRLPLLYLYQLTRYRLPNHQLPSVSVHSWIQALSSSPYTPISLRTWATHRPPEL